MAKGTSSRGSAHGTPSSLTSLLAPAQVAQSVTDVQKLYTDNPFFDPNRVVGYRAFNPEWDMGNRTYDQFVTDELGDRRKHDPTKRSARPGSLIREATSLYQTSKMVLGFKIPTYVGVCVRRKVRKEVLFARNRAGRNGGKRRHRNYWSQIKC